MNIKIKHSKDANLDNFINNIFIIKVKKAILGEIQKNIMFLKFHYNTSIINSIKDSVKHLITQHIKSSTTNMVIITIDPNYFCVKNNAKLYDICAQVNYGTLDCPACPIFTNVFEKMASEFWNFYNDYYLGFLK